MKPTAMALAFAFTACALSSEVFAQSQSGREPVEIRVSTRYVDFNEERSVSEFDQRLARAAKEACDSGASYDLNIHIQDDRCAQAAWSQAVKALNQPLLSALHNQPTTALAQASTVNQK